MLNFLPLCLAFRAVAFGFPACPSINNDSPALVTDEDRAMKYLGIPSVEDPTGINLDSALVTGVQDGNLTKYLGIPFAQAP